MKQINVLRHQIKKTEVNLCSETEMGYWLVKQEPEEFSWADLVREGRVVWDGVRNYQARNNLRAMRLGDLVLFYHSVSEKRIMGCCRVVREAFPDPTAPETERDRWSAVELVPEAAFPKPVTLAQIKAEPTLAELPLIKQSRLSVMPLTPTEFEILCRLGNWNATSYSDFSAQDLHPA